MKKLLNWNIYIYNKDMKCQLIDGKVNLWLKQTNFQSG